MARYALYGYIVHGQNQGQIFVKVFQLTQPGEVPWTEVELSYDWAGLDRNDLSLAAKLLSLFLDGRLHQVVDSVLLRHLTRETLEAGRRCRWLLTKGAQLCISHDDASFAVASDDCHATPSLSSPGHTDDQTQPKLREHSF